MTTHTSGQRFPRELLDLPAEESERYFRNKIIGHPHLQEALARVMRAIKHPSKGQLVLVFGATGSGKTTLKIKVERQILEEEQAAMQADPGYRPVGSMEALIAGRAGYNWKSHNTFALRAMDEPEALIERKMDPTKSLKRDGDGHIMVDRNTDVDTLQYALETCFKHRRTRSFLLDEAHQITERVVGAKKMLAEMSHIKSLANRTGVVPVLFGTYELLPILDLSDQVIRRSAKIHLARYRIDSETDKQDFLGVINTLQSHLPLADEPDLLSDYEYIYERSLGVVGILKEWLDRALVEILYAGEYGATLSPSFADSLRFTALSDTELIEILETINNGERAVYSRTERGGDLRARLKVHPGEDRHSRLLAPMPMSTPKAEKPSDRPQLRPGTRKAARDKVGIEKRDETSQSTPTL